MTTTWLEGIRHDRLDEICRATDFPERQLVRQPYIDTMAVSDLKSVSPS